MPEQSEDYQYYVEEIKNNKEFLATDIACCVISGLIPALFVGGGSYLYYSLCKEIIENYQYNGLFYTALSLVGCTSLLLLILTEAMVIAVVHNNLIGEIDDAIFYVQQIQKYKEKIKKLESERMKK